MCFNDLDGVEKLKKRVNFSYYLYLCNETVVVV